MLRGLIRTWNRVRLSTEPMWFLKEGTRLDQQDLPPRVRGVLDELRANGVAILRNNVPVGLCDEVNREFGAYCEKAPESSNFRDENRLYERLACLHMVSDAARRIAFAPTTLEVIEAAFRTRAVVVGSLYFHKGSTQSIHRDTPAFFTNPLNHYFGVWTALEDVLPGAGPLIYYDKGHLSLPDAKLFGDPSVSAQNYFSRIVKACQERGLEIVEYYAKKGDTLIWHPEMPHGGAAILNPRQSRRSIVFHYIPEGVPIHGAELFFGRRGLIQKKANYETVDFGRRKAIDQGQPRFFHNRDEGNFDEA